LRQLHSSSIPIIFTSNLDSPKIEKLSIDSQMEAKIVSIYRLYISQSALASHQEENTLKGRLNSIKRQSMFTWALYDFVLQPPSLELEREGEAIY